MFLSIIIPGYNCEDRIDFLLNSILQSGLESDDYEIIFVDDSRPDKIKNKLEKYFNLVQLKYIPTEDNIIHCPGNSRKIGLPYAEGDWITFIDDDDTFIKGALGKVKQYLLNHPEITMCLTTDLYEINVDCGTIERDINGWTKGFGVLHGKFFNKKNLIDKYHIDFKQDLFANEDLYFNNCVLIEYYKQDLEGFNQYHLHTYNWSKRLDSLSRKDGFGDVERVDEFFNDFMEANFLVFFNALTEDDAKDPYSKIVLAATRGLILLYFYAEVMSYRNVQPDKLRRNLLLIYNAKNLLLAKLKITPRQFVERYDIGRSVLQESFKTQMDYYKVKRIKSLEEWLQC